MTTPSLKLVLTPKWRTTLTRLRQDREAGRARIILVAAVGLVFWTLSFTVMFRILRALRAVEEIGALLAGKALGVVLLSFLSILVLSNVITALSSFFLAKDLDLLVSSPVDWLTLYLAKLGETLLHSSWMVALMSVPIFSAYGIVFRGGLLFPLCVVVMFLPLLLLPAVIGCAITLILVNVFPARRARDLLAIIAIGAAGGVVLLFRIIRPERLARPEGFRNLLDFIAILRTPTSPFLPSEWATRGIMSYLVGPFDPLAFLLLWSTAAVFVVAGAALHYRLYAIGFTRAQEGSARFVRGGFWSAMLSPLGRFLPVAKREFVIKDLKLFFRDTTQWSQLILLGVLVVIYLFNIKALPLFSGEKVPFGLVTIVAFLNQGLAGFVLASIAARFIFPSISLEGRQMWLLRSSPLDLKAMIWSKYWIGTIPLLVLALTITIFTNILLRTPPFMMAVGIGTTILLTLAIASMALGFGALYPQFETENAAQIPTSFGGLVFMMSTVALLAVVILIEAVPVYSFVRAVFRGQPVTADWMMVVAFALVVVVCLTATIVPIRVGLKKMEQFEF